MRPLAITLALAVSACAAPRVAAPAAQPPAFIEDDFPQALALARARHVPLFVDAWAPW